MHRNYILAVCGRARLTTLFLRHFRADRQSREPPSKGTTPEGTKAILRITRRRPSEGSFISRREVIKARRESSALFGIDRKSNSREEGGVQIWKIIPQSIIYTAAKLVVGHAKHALPSPSVYRPSDARYFPPFLARKFHI